VIGDLHPIKPRGEYYENAQGDEPQNTQPQANLPLLFIVIECVVGKYPHAHRSYLLMEPHLLTLRDGAYQPIGNPYAVKKSIRLTNKNRCLNGFRQIDRRRVRFKNLKCSVSGIDGRRWGSLGLPEAGFLSYAATRGDFIAVIGSGRLTQDGGGLGSNNKTAPLPNYAMTN
jgi:hypothetical protein